MNNKVFSYENKLCCIVSSVQFLEHSQEWFFFFHSGLQQFSTILFKNSSNLPRRLDIFFRHTPQIFRDTIFLKTNKQTNKKTQSVRRGSMKLSYFSMTLKLSHLSLKKKTPHTKSYQSRNLPTYSNFKQTLNFVLSNIIFTK